MRFTLTTDAMLVLVMLLASLSVFVLEYALYLRSEALSIPSFAKLALDTAVCEDHSVLPSTHLRRHIW